MHCYPRSPSPSDKTLPILDAKDRAVKVPKTEEIGVIETIRPCSAEVWPIQLHTCTHTSASDRLKHAHPFVHLHLHCTIPWYDVNVHMTNKGPTLTLTT